MSAIPDEASFIDLMDQRVKPAQVVAIATPAGEPFGLPFLREYRRLRTLNADTFPCTTGHNPNKYDGDPYFKIVFPGSTYTIDRIDRADTRKHLPKVMFPSDIPSELYWPDGHTSRYATSVYTGLGEGQATAAALHHALQIPFVGIPGCYGWGQKIKAVSEFVEHTVLRDKLALGLGPGRFHIVCFDGDWKTNDKVRQELGTYCTEASYLGSEIIAPDFGIRDGKRLGGDDWLYVTYGDSVPAPDVVLRALLDLPRVPWQTLPVRDSFYTSNIEKFNRGHIDFTDRGNATFLLRIYGPGNLQYLEDTKEWVCFTDGRWQKYGGDAYELVNPAALQRLHLHENLKQQAMLLPEPPERPRGFKGPFIPRELLLLEAENLWKSFNFLSGNSGRNAVLQDLKTREGVRTVRGAFDNIEHILNTPSGVVDLNTGKLRPATRADMCLNCTLVPYSETEPKEPEALKIKKWFKEITSISHGNPDPRLAYYLLSRMGAELRGRNVLSSLNIWHGEGSGGKSALAKLDVTMMGDYGTMIPAQVILSAYANNNPEAATPFAMMTVSKRKAFMSETKDTAQLDETRLKALTGGDIAAMRGLYSGGRMYEPTVSLTLATNNLPAIRNMDPALIDRLAVIPFRCRWNRPNKILDSTGDTGLPIGDAWFIDFAYRSVDAMRWLLWAEVKAGVAFSRRGFRLPRAPSSIAQSTKNYAESQDDIREFLSEGPYRLWQMGDGELRKIRSSLVYEAYKNFIEAAGRQPVNSSTFSKRLKERFPSIELPPRSGGKSYILGLVERARNE